MHNWMKSPHYYITLLHYYITALQIIEHRLWQMIKVTTLLHYWTTLAHYKGYSNCLQSAPYNFTTLHFYIIALHILTWPHGMTTGQSQRNTLLLHRITNTWEFGMKIDWTQHNTIFLHHNATLPYYNHLSIGYGNWSKSPQYYITTLQLLELRVWQLIKVTTLLNYYIALLMNGSVSLTWMQENSGCSSMLSEMFQLITKWEKIRLTVFKHLAPLGWDILKPRIHWQCF